jgi:hypothetical protein
LLNIDLDSYTEFKTPYAHSGSNSLFYLIRSYDGIELSKEQGLLMRAVLRYAKVVNSRIVAVQQLNAVIARERIDRDTYVSLVRRYYKEMEAEVLKGKAYKFNSNLGIVLVNYLKTSSFLRPKAFINWQATKKAKEALIEEGKVPYDKEKHEAYIKAGLETQYDGIRYTIYENRDFSFQVVWAWCGVKNFKNYKLVDNDACGFYWKYHKIKPEDDIKTILYSPFTMATKLAVINKKHPEYKNRFVRNKECHVYKYRRNNRQSS